MSHVGRWVYAYIFSPVNFLCTFFSQCVHRGNIKDEFPPIGTFDYLSITNATARALRKGKLEPDPKDTLIDRAVSLNIIDDEAGTRLHAAETARSAIIQVDAFDPETYADLKG